MNKTIRLLAILAVVQTGLVLATHIGGHSLAAGHAQQNLLAFDSQAVDTVSIQGEKDQPGDSVTISKKDGQWQLPDGFPADADKLTQLLDKLGDLKHGLPVATTAPALARFKVDDTGYERLISLQQGGKTLARLYLGKGAGARQSYARDGGDNAVYSVALGSYDVPATVDDWRDKRLLQLDETGISSLELDGIRLQRDEADDAKDSTATTWEADTLPEGKQLDQQVVNDLLAKLSGLRFDKVLGKKDKSAYGLDKPEQVISLVHDGKNREYRFGKFKGDYVLKVPERAEYFLIANYNAEPLLKDSSRDKLLVNKSDALAAPDVSTPGETLHGAVQEPADSASGMAG